MVVYSAGPNECHSPPYEIDGGERVPPADVSARIDAILRGLLQLPSIDIREAASVSIDRLLTVHAPDYVEFLRGTCKELSRRTSNERGTLFGSVFPFREGQIGRNHRSLMGQYCFDTFTPLLPGTFDAAMNTASAALAAADHLATGGERFSYALGRPPGHHAERARCGGYSYLNGTALAAERLARIGKVAVLDIDVHHGNGTQHAFYDRAGVFTVSIHGDPADLFPYFSGFETEMGSGPGEGFNVNFPLALGSGDRDYQRALETAIKRIERFAPKYLVVALGFDAHQSDPIGRLGLSTAFFGSIARTIAQLDLPTMFVQEGGYAVASLPEIAASFFGGLTS